MSSNEKKPKRLVSASEHHKINREVLVWVNTYPDLPVHVIQYEELPADGVGMALSVIQGTFITASYIMGGYRAEYQFKLIYRIKPGKSIDTRLRADELLDDIGDWAAVNHPSIPGISVRKVEVTARASLFAVYENGDEDHQILMKLTYEVI